MKIAGDLSGWKVNRFISMSDQKLQAKIPVKKSDGSTVFLTMEEFREYKKKSSAPVPPSEISFDAPVPPASRAPKKLEQGKVEKVESPLPMVQSTEIELATTTPVKDVFVDAAKVETPVAQKSEWKQDDHSSLLEEDIDQEKKVLPSPPALSESASSILSTVKAQFPFPVSKDIEGRFDSLVLSRIRDIRTPLDFEQYAKMSKQEGGLGMEEDQARLLLAVITAAQKISGNVPEAPKATSKDQPPVTSMRVSPTITPVMNPPSTPRIPIPVEPAEYSFTAPSKSQVPSGTGGKPMMQDVTMPSNQKKTMGPVDEIHYLSLVDFRRLSPKTESAKEILKGKFQNLQEESYVLFLDARDAWHESPLFTVYQDTVLEALNTKRPLLDVIGQNSNGLNADELKALIEINHYLG